jgi:acyl-CoA thioesterase-1
MRRLLPPAALVVPLLLAALLCAAPLPAATIVCLGDSLTAGRGLDEADAYPALVQELAHADHLAWTVVNAGVSGDTSAGGLRRLGWTLKARPDWLFVALGANDGLRGQPPEETRRNLDAICAQAVAAGTRVALAGMILPANYGAEHRAAFAALFPAIAAERKLPLLPFLLAGVAGKAELNQADGIHPTAEGQHLVARTVYAFLKPLVEGGGKQPDTVGGQAESKP